MFHFSQITLGSSGQCPRTKVGYRHISHRGHCRFGITFGRAIGYMAVGATETLLDVHGAGAIRSDPKSGSATNYPASFGPQGDVQVVYNYVRCVR